MAFLVVRLRAEHRLASSFEGGAMAFWAFVCHLRGRLAPEYALRPKVPGALTYILIWGCLMRRIVEWLFDLVGMVSLSLDRPG